MKAHSQMAGSLPELLIVLVVSTIISSTAWVSFANLQPQLKLKETAERIKLIVEELSIRVLASGRPGVLRVGAQKITYGLASHPSKTLRMPPSYQLASNFLKDEVLITAENYCRPGRLRLSRIDQSCLLIISLRCSLRIDCS